MKYFLALILCTLFTQGFCDSEKENNSENNYSDEKECSACHGGSIYKLSEEQEKEYGKKVTFWKNTERKKIVRIFKFTTQDYLLSFIDKVAELAEKVGHHPDLLIKKNSLTCSLYTHSLNALSEIDFSMAQKIDAEWERQKKEDGDNPEFDDMSNDPCALIDCNYTRSIQRSLFRKYNFYKVAQNKVAPKKLITRDSDSNEDNSSKDDNSWTILKNLSARIYRRVTLESFMTAINSLKNLIINFDKQGYGNFEVYLYYTNIRVDLKHALTEKSSIKPEIIELAQSIDEILKT